LSKLLLIRAKTKAEVELESR